MLFDRRTQKVAKIGWAIISVLIIVGMVLVYAPGLY